MKKLCSLLMGFILILSFTTTLNAAIERHYYPKSNYYLEELDMYLDIPDVYDTFTRETAPKDPKLKEYGLSKDALLDTMKSQNMYLDAYNKSDASEITVTMVPNTTGDFKSFSVPLLKALSANLYKEYENAGLSISSCELVESLNHYTPFIRVYFSYPNDNKTVYALQYYTVYENQAISITLKSFDAHINSTHELFLKESMSTASFHPGAIHDNHSTPAFKYIDKDTGVEFMVPENWIEEELSQERNFVKARFASNQTPGITILYSSTDVWATLSISEQAGYTRSSLNNAAFQTSEIATMLGVPESEVFSGQYAGKSYFGAETTATESAYGLDLEITMTNLVHFENGFCYTFQFSSSKDNELYADFESLLSSVQYPAVTTASFETESAASNVGRSSQVGSTTTHNPELIKDRFSILNLLINLAFTICIYSLPIIIYRYVIRKEPVEPQKAKRITIIYGVCAVLVVLFIRGFLTDTATVGAGSAVFLWSEANYLMLSRGNKSKKHAISTDTSSITPATYISSPTYQPTSLENDYASHLNNAEPIRVTLTPKFCNNCGAQLVEGSQFCHKCGAKIK